MSLTTAVSAASYDAESIACFLTEADSNLCAYCKGAYASDTQYEATFATFRWTKTAPKLATAATSLFDAANLQLQGLPVVLPQKNYGTEVDSFSRTGYVFVLEKMVMGTDKKTLECIASFTDPTAGTEARETVVKDGMAKIYQGASAGIATRTSLLATRKLGSTSTASGALSNIATVGAALAAIAISF